ncbi:MAG: Hpt domain-containing protein [Magnetococcales bacterium]|nr:Hpt domain-containing protein [Magnetococcales bacterium]MBF0263134.1 Hpt domain-containing protein [Magnetococcales bacterium]
MTTQDTMHDFENAPLLDDGLKLRLLHDEVGGQVRDIVDKFLEILPDRLRHLAHSHARGDTVDFTIEAHRLKGAAATLGAERMAALCAHLEARGKAGILPEPALLHALDDLSIQVREIMTRTVARYAGDVPCSLP